MLFTLTPNDQLALALGIAGLLFLLINLLLLKRNQPKHIPEPSKEAVENLLHVSSEQGKRLVVSLGQALTNASFDLAGASGFNLQRALLKRSLFNDHPLKSFSGDGTLACLSRMMVHGAYRGALASELFRGSLSQLSGTSPLAYTASLVNQIPDSSNAGLLLAGQMSPVMLLVLDQADRQMLPAVTALSSLSGQAAGFFGNSLNLIGEDVFNAAGKLDQRKSVLASLSAQDWLRLAISIGLLLGAILKMGGGAAMKRLLPLIVGALSGLLVLAAMFFIPQGGAILSAVLNWVIVVASVALLVAIASLVLTHLRFIAKGKKGFLLNIVLVVSFITTLILGTLFGVDDPIFLRFVGAIIRPIETALLGLVALVLMSAAMKIFDERGWSVLTVSFGVSAIVFLILGLGFLQNLKIPVLTEAIRIVEGLPMIGARGLLIGIGIGLLMMAFRVLFGMEGSAND